MRLQGKTALIAGGSRNIGKSIALTFARAGADLVLAATQAILRIPSRNSSSTGKIPIKWSYSDWLHEAKSGLMSYVEQFEESAGRTLLAMQVHSISKCKFDLGLRSVVASISPWKTTHEVLIS